jgi:hypothetical protein
MVGPLLRRERLADGGAEFISYTILLVSHMFRECVFLLCRTACGSKFSCQYVNQSAAVGTAPLVLCYALMDE